MQFHRGCLNFILDGNKFKVLQNLAFVLDISDFSNTCTDLKSHAFQLEEERKLLYVSMLNALVVYKKLKVDLKIRK